MIKNLNNILQANEHNSFEYLYKLRMLKKNYACSCVKILVCSVHALLLTYFIVWS